MVVRGIVFNNFRGRFYFSGGWSRRRFFTPPPPPIPPKISYCQDNSCGSVAPGLNNYGLTMTDQVVRLKFFRPAPTDLQLPE